LAKRQLKVEMRNARQFLRQRGGIGKDGMVNLVIASNYFWRRMKPEMRQEWLIIAGWDPGGWVFYNWHQLPEQMRLDLARVVTARIEALIKV